MTLHSVGLDFHGDVDVYTLLRAHGPFPAIFESYKSRNRPSLEIFELP